MRVKRTTYYDAQGQFQFAYEELAYNEKEIAGYLYAGMRAKKALQKFGGAALTKDFAERFVHTWFEDAPLRMRRGRMLVKKVRCK